MNVDDSTSIWYNRAAFQKHQAAHVGAAPDLSAFLRMAGMAQLIVSCGDRAPYHVTLTEDVLTIGRGEKNGLVLDDEFASREHAEVRFDDGKYVLRDLASTNGTRVNGELIPEKELAEGDRITIGRHELVLRYTQGEPGHAPAEAGGGPTDVRADIQRIKRYMNSVGEKLSLVTDAKRLQNSAQTEPTDQNIVAIGKAYRRLEALYEAARLVVSQFDLKKRLERILDSAIRVTGADRGFIVLADAAGRHLHTEVAREMGSDVAEGSPSLGIASRSAIHGEMVLVEDALRDARFSTRESVILGQIRSAMSVPLKVENRLLGSIYVDSRNEEHRFTEEDLELFEAVASQSAIAIENVQLTERMIEEERRRANLERFLSPRVVDQVLRSPGVIELGGTKQEVTALFSDIRGFTGIAERLPPAEVVSLLNEYFTGMAEIIFRHDGTLDKYVGDEIMAVFGSPVRTPDHSSRAVTVALEMQREVKLMAGQWLKENRPAFQIGIGIASGTAIAGYVGSPKRMEFTAIGDIVNVGRRLCASAQPGQILVSENVAQGLSEQFLLKPLGPMVLKGRENPVSVYELLGLR